MLQPLYAILDIDLCRARGHDPIAVVDAWLGAGVRLIQLRAKTLAGEPMLALADRICQRTRAARATFIVNDRVDVARLAGADGVHVGQGDLAPADVRVILPRPALVGLSTHNDKQVRQALAEPIDYLAIGPVYATGSKTNPDPVVGLEGVRHAVALAGRTPVVAIGGITASRVAAVLGAGASSVAVLSDLVDDDPATRARALLDAVGAIH